MSVNIPAGVETRLASRLAGEGKAGIRGGPAETLHLPLDLPDDIFQRDGPKIFLPRPITMATAALGGQVEVPHHRWRSRARQISEGTETGKQFRLRGKGMPFRSKLTGDLYVQVEVETPQNLTRKQKSC